LKEEVEDAEVEEDEENTEAEQEEDDQKNIHISPKTPSRRVQKNHPSEHIIGNKYAGVETRRKLCSPEQRHLALFSTVEPSSFEEASTDEH
jgi:hypothetical protein